jgi:two-component system, chemotaxis family, protein-glutamate methylesterase/glutaminase
MIKQLVVIGGSAGSLDALLKMLPILDPQAGFALVIVVHRKSGEDQILEDLIKSRSSLRLIPLEDKTKLEHGCVYVAPADYHLLFEQDQTLSLDLSPKENYSRPSLDVTFGSAAMVFGERLLCILLSGANNDGTAGLLEVKRLGGLTAIQDPKTADVPYMPLYAARHASPSYSLGPLSLARLINHLK